MQTVKVKGRSFQKLELKEMDGQMDRGNCITSLANKVGKNTTN